MLQRFIAVTLIACIAGLLVACDNTARSNSVSPSPATENTLQLNFPTPPSAEMKSELKRAKYQLQQENQESKTDKTSF